MYFRANLKMKKPTLCCCFTWIVFIELNFIVAFLLIRKTWEDPFVGKAGGQEMVDFKEWGPCNRGDDFEMGGWYSFTDYVTSIQGLHYMKSTALGLKLVYSFINFIIPLPVTYVRCFWCNAKDWQSVCLCKYRELLNYFGKKAAEALLR